MKLINFPSRQVTCLKTIKVNWLVRFRPVQSKLSTYSQVDNSTWSSTHCTVLSCDSCQWLKLSCLCSFRAPLPLADQDSFCWQRQFSPWKFVHFVVCLQWADTMLGALSFPFFFFFLVQNRPNNDTTTETPDKWTETEAGQSSVTADYVSIV